MTEPSAAPPPEPQATSTPRASEYTAVVYFHGIGQQRHYEDMCRLVQRLDEYVSSMAGSRTNDPDFRDMRLDTKPRSEPYGGGESEDAADIVYLTTRVSGGGRPSQQVRFFEAFWAPEAAEAPGAMEVVAWLARQLGTPLRLLLSPWRSYERLRRGDLVGLCRARRDAGDEQPGLEGLRNKLAGFYSTFQERNERRAHARGTFAEFLEFVRSKSDDVALIELLHGWHDHHRWREIRNVFAVASLLIGIASGAGLLFLASYWLLVQFAPYVMRDATGSAWLSPSFSNAITLMTAVLAAVGGTRFLRGYIGDVQQFVTYEEAEPLFKRRKAIIDSAVRHLRHVMADERCGRIVMVCHSLGTAVAVDALLDLRRFNVARHPADGDPLNGPVRIDKVTHLVTMGSPIDKINYFFAALSSRYRIYDMLVEKMRGDLGTPPFSTTGRKPRIHWFNYWDRADLISGPIETVAPDILREQEVDNVRVASYPLPAPVAAHDGYLHHAGVLDDLCRIVFADRYSYVRASEEARLSGEKNARPDFKKERRGPGSASRVQDAFAWLLLLVPWLMFAALVEVLLAGPVIAQWMLAVTVVILVVAQWQQGKGRWHLFFWRRSAEV